LFSGPQELGGYSATVSSKGALSVSSTGSGNNSQFENWAPNGPNGVEIDVIWKPGKPGDAHPTSAKIRVRFSVECDSAATLSSGSGGKWAISAASGVDGTTLASSSEDKNGSNTKHFPPIGGMTSKFSPIQTENFVANGDGSYTAKFFVLVSSLQSTAGAEADHGPGTGTATALSKGVVRAYIAGITFSA